VAAHLGKTPSAGTCRHHSQKRDVLLAAWQAQTCGIFLLRLSNWHACSLELPAIEVRPETQVHVLHCAVHVPPASLLHGCAPPDTSCTPTRTHTAMMVNQARSVAQQPHRQHSLHDSSHTSVVLALCTGGNAGSYLGADRQPDQLTCPVEAKKCL